MIADLVSSIRPHDQPEQEHSAVRLAWIDSGGRLFRILKPGILAQWIVSHVILDEHII